MRLVVLVQQQTLGGEQEPDHCLPLMKKEGVMCRKTFWASPFRFQILGKPFPGLELLVKLVKWLGTGRA